MKSYRYAMLFVVPVGKVSKPSPNISLTRAPSSLQMTYAAIPLHTPLLSSDLAPGIWRFSQAREAPCPNEGCSCAKMQSDRYAMLFLWVPVARSGTARNISLTGDGGAGARTSPHRLQRGRKCFSI